MNFSSKKVTSTFTSPHTKNCWGYLEGIGWRKVKPDTTDGCTNMFLSLSAAKANDRTVSGTIEDATNEITLLYLS